MHQESSALLGTIDIEIFGSSRLKTLSAPHVEPSFLSSTNVMAFNQPHCSAHFTQSHRRSRAWPSTHRRRRTPAGWCFRHFVPRRGPNPKCKGCGKKIGKSELAVKHSHVEKSTHRFRKVDQFHCQRSCIETVSQEHLDSFLQKHWLKREVIAVVNDIIKGSVKKRLFDEEEINSEN